MIFCERLTEICQPPRSLSRVHEKVFGRSPSHVISSSLFLYLTYVHARDVNFHYVFLESPTPRSKSALAQLLASVQGGDHLSPTDTKQLTPQKERGRKRSVRTGSSQSTTPVSGNLTPVQQKNFQLLLQQQQPQQGNVASTGQIVLGQQGIAASTAR